MLTRLNIGPAFRKSRQIAGGMTGLFFALGNVLKIPLKAFLSGYGPALTTLSVSLMDFGSQLIENHQSSAPDNNAIAIKANETLFTTRIIIDKLNQNSVKTRDFLISHNITSAEIERLEKWNNDEDVWDTFVKVYNSVEFDIEKYPASFIFSITEMSAHFMEVMLIQAYIDSEAFEYGDHATVGNIILSLLFLLALYNGIKTFFETKHCYEHPSASKLSNTLFKYYEKHSVKTNEEHQPEIALKEIQVKI